MITPCKKCQWKVEYNKAETITVLYGVVAHGRIQLTACMKISSGGGGGTPI